MRVLAAAFLFGSMAFGQTRLVVLGPFAELRKAASARGWTVAEKADAPSLLAGSISDVLFAASRTPGAYIAALAIGGDPRQAIESNRIFAANLSLVPLLWVGPADAAATAQALKERIPTLEFRAADRIAAAEALDWLAAQQPEPLPLKIDCETGSTDFGRCYWASILKLDPSRRNDVLPATRVAPGSGAFLALGAFGYDPAAPGPGILVASLPQGYKGPLHAQDRIVALAGKKIDDGRHFLEMMDAIREERSIAVLVQRGQERLRIETRTALPKREETVTGRLQAEYTPEAHELLVISRGVGAFHLTIPPHWVPARVNWNGEDAGELSEAGCWVVDGSAKATRCGP